MLTERQLEILKIADCCSNLYGVYSMTQLIKVFNEFYKEKVTKDEIYHLCDVDDHEKYSNTVFYTDCIAHKSIADEDIDKILKAQRGASYYMPKSLKELLKYDSRLYMEPNKTYEELFELMKNHMITSLKKKEALETLSLTLPASCKIGLLFEMVLYIFTDYGIIFDHAKLSDIALLYDKSLQTVRMWTRKGLTQKELLAYQKSKKTEK